MEPENVEIELEGPSLLQEVIVDGVAASEGYTIIVNDPYEIPLDAGGLEEFVTGPWFEVPMLQILYTATTLEVLH